mmetsp:Transcript_632/g.2474  ORF Transcript_632/g.2474 Transcript_632/m.2474 type:complete len:271 (-) Transcript_632:9-821(-)
MVNVPSSAPLATNSASGSAGCVHPLTQRTQFGSTPAAFALPNPTTPPRFFLGDALAPPALVAFSLRNSLAATPKRHVGYNATHSTSAPRSPSAKSHTKIPPRASPPTMSPLFGNTHSASIAHVGPSMVIVTRPVVKSRACTRPSVDEHAATDAPVDDRAERTDATATSVSNAFVCDIRRPLEVFHARKPPSSEPDSSVASGATHNARAAPVSLSRTSAPDAVSRSGEASPSRAACAANGSVCAASVTVFFISDSIARRRRRDARLLRARD